MSRLAIILMFIMLAICGGGGASSAEGEPATGDVEVLRTLLISRLSLMEQVAAYKWNVGLPVEDPAREANVLKATMARSRAAGLKPDVVRRFVVAQMDAAKTVQRHYFDIWREQSVDRIADAPDLATVLRPRIGALSAELIAAMAEAREELETCAAVSILRPLPRELSDVPPAWNIAVDGVLGDRTECP